MPPWWLKAGTQKTLSLLPASRALNRFFQTHLTRSLELTDDRLRDQLGRCARHLEAFRRHRGGIPSTVLDIGTGWHPILPLGFFLCGVGDVGTVDRAPHMRAEDARTTFRALENLIAAGEAERILPAIRPERVARLRDAIARGASDPLRVLWRLGIHYRVGGVETVAPLSASVELAVTNSVLEHLTPVELESLFRALRRIVSPFGVASHFIDLGDHYAIFDRRIDVYNFLRFTDRAWSLINCPLHYQSRLRIHDYRRLFAATGWKIADEESQRATPADLAKVPLAPRFRDLPPDDLLVYRSWITLQPESR